LKGGIKMAKEEIKKVIDEIVKEAVEPLKEQKTNWVDTIRKEAIPMEEKQDKGLRAARIVRALAASKGDPEKAAFYAKKNFDDSAVVKALETGTGTAGGFIVPEEYSTEIIELLRPQSVVRRMGAVTLPMRTGTLNIPKLAGGGQAQYIGENTDVPKTEPSFGTVQLTFKKLAALVPISNDLLRYSNPAADMIVRDDLVMAIAEREDKAFIRGERVTSGSPQLTPVGLRYWAPSTHVIEANQTVTAENVAKDLGKLVLALKEANVRFIRPGWLMSPRTEMYLLTARDTSGVYAFRDEMVTGKLFGYPYAVTTNIPENLTVTVNSTSVEDTTEVYLVDFADAIIGESTQLIIDASTEASYMDMVNSTPVMYSAFSMDQTLIRVIAEHDFVMRHPESVAVLTAVKWSA